jgi:hypothetical protein
MLPKRICVVQVNEKSWEGLRVNFRVDKFSDRSLNAAKIEIYGLSRESISEFQRPESVVRLFAGYDDNASLIFFGNPIRGGARRENDSVSVEAADGANKLRRTFINETFPPGTSLEVVVARLTFLLGVPTGFIRTPANVSFSEGLTLSGRLSDAFDTITQSIGHEWNVTDGKINFYEQGYAKGTGLLISSKNKNLIGSPVPKDDGNLEVVTLLEPALQPRSRVRLDSEDYKGTYTVIDVMHEGDTHDANWYTTCVLRRG